MSSLAPDRLDDDQLESHLVRIAAQDRATTAELIAHLAEADARQLHLRRGYESLLAYCVEHLRYSEAAAHKRIGVARVAREHPGILPRLADGALTLSTVLTLRPWLNGAHADELLAFCAGKSRAAVEVLLAERFPRSEAFEWGTWPEVVAPPTSNESAGALAPGRTAPSIPQKAVLNDMEGTTTPLTGARDVLQVTITRETQLKLQRVRELLGFAVGATDAATVIDRALESLIVSLEKRRHGLHTRPRNTDATPSRRVRHVPAALRRAVFERDGGRCAFVSDTGRRCTSRHALEYDHVEPIALGGTTTLENLRLLCPAHNQSEAMRRLGADLVRRRRARRRAAALEDSTGASPLPPSHEADLRAALRNLGYRGSEIGVGLDAATHVPHDADLAMRLRSALRALGRGTLEASRRAGARATG
jgi:5-methylcytosine-specific restriction endonuclease McrA